MRKHILLISIAALLTCAIIVRGSQNQNSRPTSVVTSELILTDHAGNPRVRVLFDEQKDDVVFIRIPYAVEEKNDGKVLRQIVPDAGAAVSSEKHGLRVELMGWQRTERGFFIVAHVSNVTETEIKKLVLTRLHRDEITGDVIEIPNRWMEVHDDFGNEFEIDQTTRALSRGEKAMPKEPFAEQVRRATEERLPSSPVDLYPGKSILLRVSFRGRPVDKAQHFRITWALEPGDSAGHENASLELPVTALLPVEE